MMKESGKKLAVLYALLAAVFYAFNTPFSKLLLREVPPTLMAAFLYLGAGLGVGILYLFRVKREPGSERLTRKDLPYTVGMILLDILAPVFLMLGISVGSAANASLLGNFEIVATTVIALAVFREAVSGTLWAAVGLITLSSVLLSFEGSGSFQFSYGSLLVLLAASCWGLENNCTRKISDKSSYQIVVLKGVFSGGGSLVIGLLTGERLPAARYLLWAMALGFVAYGLSIFLYVRAQRDLGAAKTSAYYAVAPFIGSFLSFVIHGEALTGLYFAGLFFMLAGSALVVYDTLGQRHTHAHTHTVRHTHDGSTHTHTVTHEHPHTHLTKTDRHRHGGRAFLHSPEHQALHAHDH